MTIIIASLLKTFQFDLCLVSEIFSFFPELCPILLVMGVGLLQFLSIWLMKTATKESFSLKTTQSPSFQLGIWLIM